jgi:hypothetical protein
MDGWPLALTAETEASSKKVAFFRGVQALIFGASLRRSAQAGAHTGATKRRLALQTAISPRECRAGTLSMPAGLSRDLDSGRRARPPRRFHLLKQ